LESTTRFTGTRIFMRQLFPARLCDRPPLTQPSRNCEMAATVLPAVAQVNGF
jgi:hypothetical protein